MAPCAPDRSLLRVALISTVVCAAALLAACTDGDGAQLFEDPALVLGAGAGELDHGGGVLRSQDGRFAVIVPAGALDTRVGLTIDPLPEELDNTVGAAYRAEPGALTFGPAATIEVKIEPRAIDVATLTRLRIAVLDELGQLVPLADPVVDTATATLRASSSTLGTFAVIAAGCGADGDCEDGLVCAADATCRLPVCISSDDCGTGQLCISERCTVAPTCAQRDECATDRICTPEGVCAPRASCLHDVDCGDDGACVDGQCHRVDECSADGDCDAGTRCELGRCVPGSDCGDRCECVADDDCMLGHECVENRCESRRTCAVDEDCGAGRSCTDGLCQ